MTGRLQGTLFAKPVEIIASGRSVQLRVDGFRSAWRLRRFAQSGTQPLAKVMRHLGMDLRLVVGGRFEIAVLPEPSPLARLLLRGN